jgi:uncharacterized protein (DUF488 family)
MRIYTIGHSILSIETFLGILASHSVQGLIDIRSVPASRRAPQYNRKNLALALNQAGIQYDYLGDQLGGYPQDPTCYQSPLPENRRLRNYPPVDYDKVARRTWYQDGILELVQIARVRTSVILCAEEDPLECHRHLLVTPSLVSMGMDVIHIRGDGSLQPV